jgi:alcohol oxidase
MRMYRGEYSAGHPKFRKGSPAECRPAEGPVGIDEPNIVYSKEDDEAIDQYHKENVATAWHSV